MFARRVAVKSAEDFVQRVARRSSSWRNLSPTCKAYGHQVLMTPASFSPRSRCGPEAHSIGIPCTRLSRESRKHRPRNIGELLAKNRAGELTLTESVELDEVEHIENFLRKLKIRALKDLQQPPNVKNPDP
jgi:hypothetical protein